VENGSFSDDLRCWRLDKGESGIGTIAVESGVLHMVTDPGSFLETWRLQAVQKYPGFYLHNGKTYTVSFKAWSTANRNVDVSVWENGRDLDGDGSLWHPYGSVQEFSLTTIEQTFSFDITMSIDDVSIIEN